MQTYSVRFRFMDRKKGPEGRTIRVQASSITVATSRATREFWRGLTRKERFDAGKELSIVARKAVELQEAPAEVYRMFEQAVRG